MPIKTVDTGIFQIKALDRESFLSDLKRRMRQLEHALPGEIFRGRVDRDLGFMLWQKRSNDIEPLLASSMEKAEKVVERYGKTATDCLAKHWFRELPPDLPPEFSGAGSEYKILSDQTSVPPQLTGLCAMYRTLAANQSQDYLDACEILYAMSFLEPILKLLTGKMDKDELLKLVGVSALSIGWVLGAATTRLEARQHEKSAFTGRKVRRIDAEGRQSEALRLAKERKQKQYTEWSQCAQEIRQRHPNLSAWDVARHVKDKLKPPQKADTIRRKLREILGKV